MPIAVVIGWYGPISAGGSRADRLETLKKARSFARENWISEALYMVSGKRPYQRERSLQYVGVSNEVSGRLHSGRLDAIASDFSIWVGEIISHGVPGRKKGRHSTAVNLAEWASAYFLKLHLNDQKRRTPPREPILLVNRWYRTDCETPWVRRTGGKDWPDLIEYDGPGEGARVVWIGGRGKVIRYSAADVGSLARPTRST